MHVFDMKIKVPRGITKDQIVVVLILGTVTGFYGWNDLLQKYMKEQRQKKQEPNEKFSRLGLIIIGATSCVVGCKIYVAPWYVKRKCAEAERCANIIYEAQKRKALQEQQNEI